MGVTTMPSTLPAPRPAGLQKTPRWRAAARSRRFRTNQRLPRVEALEERTLLATIPVLQVNEYPAATFAGTLPGHITLGGDGNLWITETSPNNVAKITPQGVVTQYPDPNAGGAPDRIATAGDGSVWFTDGTSFITKVSSSGMFTPVQLPGAPSFDPLAFGIGPDGAVWVKDIEGTGFTPDKLVRINPSRRPTTPIPWTWWSCPSAPSTTRAPRSCARSMGTPSMK
jgi:hypothetical protein